MKHCCVFVNIFFHVAYSFSFPRVILEQTRALQNASSDMFFDHHRPFVTLRSQGRFQGCVHWCWVGCILRCEMLESEILNQMYHPFAYLNSRALWIWLGNLGISWYVFWSIRTSWLGWVKNPLSLIVLSSLDLWPTVFVGSPNSLRSRITSQESHAEMRGASLWSMRSLPFGQLTSWLSSWSYVCLLQLGYHFQKPANRFKTKDKSHKTPWNIH